MGSKGGRSAPRGNKAPVPYKEVASRLGVSRQVVWTLASACKCGSWYVPKGRGGMHRVFTPAEVEKMRRELVRRRAGRAG